MRIGVFDSGIGGLTVLKELVRKYPNNEYIYVGDTLNVPYGEKNKNELFSLSAKIIDYLLLKKIDIIIIACGTVSSNIKDELIRKYSIPIIMVLFHDCFCHGKIRLSSEGSESPNYFYNPYDNYEIYYHDENGESGRLFEFYISRNKDDIRFLKYSLEPLPELLDADLWTGKNLDKLN